MNSNNKKAVLVLGARLDSVSYGTASAEIVRRASAREGGYVCAVNVHMVMEGVDDPSFRALVNRSVLSVPDGMPIVWAMRLLGVQRQTRVYGPFLMRHCLRRAVDQNLSIGLLGGAPDVLDKLIYNLRKEFSTLRIVYNYSPPYRALSFEESLGIKTDIAAASPDILFVGLGCPKQERWMAEHAMSLNTVMIGVGAAFDFYAGTLEMAPPVLQRFGLEWAFRLAKEPKRLLGRYAKHNPRFMVAFLRQLVSRKGRAFRRID